MRLRRSPPAPFRVLAGHDAVEFGMNRTELVAAIDQEIANLQQVRSLLAGESSITLTGAKVRVVPQKRTLSPEARAKIAAAQKKRWAAQRKSAQD